MHAVTRTHARGREIFDYLHILCMHARPRACVRVTVCVRVHLQM